MSWFDKKKTCVHCNKNKTKRDFEDHPTCAACKVEILMTREAVRKCPVDGATLVKSTANELIIDSCPECQGVWLDAGELKAIKEAAQQEGLAIGMVVF
jgi:hypothetical protein